MPSILDVIQFDVAKTQPLPSFGPNENPSDLILTALQRKYGAIKYTQQSVSRYPWYSYIPYPLAGSSRLSFFGQNQSTVTPMFSNIAQAGNIGNYSYLIQCISFDFFLYIPTVANNSPWAYTLDALAPYVDIVHGFTQGGFHQLVINDTVWDEGPLPFMYSPPATGKLRIVTSQGAFALTQSGMSPFAVTGTQTVLCAADLERRFNRRRNLQNPIFLAPQTTFDMSIQYDFGAIPVLATTAITGAAFAPTAPTLFVGCRWDGIRYAPVQ